MSCLTTTSYCAVEKSNIFIDKVFSDEDDASVVPNNITWKLTDGGGVVINDRTSVSVTPAASITILLYGDDLPWEGTNPDDTYSIYLLIEGEYNSTIQNNIPFKEETEIIVRNLRAVS